jgi:hypothetical protein
MGKPGFYFYTGDWIKDTRCLSAEARGCWIDLLCVLQERDGSVRWQPHTFDQYWGMVDNGEIYYSIYDILDELKNTRTAEVEFSVTRNASSQKDETWITVTCRRIQREAKERNLNKERQQRHRQKKKSNGLVTPEYSASSSSSSLYLISGSSSKTQKNPDPASPAPSADPLPSAISERGKIGMGRSMNLSPELKRETDRLYFSDRIKYKRVAAWVAEGRKEGFLESDMAEALRQFWDVRDEVSDWYPWLDAVVEGIDEKREKAEEKVRVDEFEREHERRKALEREFSREWNLAKGIFGDAQQKKKS